MSPMCVVVYSFDTFYSWSRFPGGGARGPGATGGGRAQRGGQQGRHIQGTHIRNLRLSRKFLLAICTVFQNGQMIRYTMSLGMEE
jgi:hypothetical protein